MWRMATGLDYTAFDGPGHIFKWKHYSKSLYDFCNYKLVHFNKIRESNLMKSFLLASGAEIIVLALRTLVTNPRNLPTASVTRDTLWSISPTFYERICNNIFAPKNFQTLTVSTKKALNFCTKKPHVKCWWNWHLVDAFGVLLSLWRTCHPHHVVLLLKGNWNITYKTLSYFTVLQWVSGI